MKSTGKIVVTKSDGSMECFSAAKLAACLARVLQGRSYDRRLAGPLTRAVSMHLSECHGSTPPTTQYIYRCVCSVLEQTGLADVATDLTNHRCMRMARRRRTRLLDGSQRGGRRGTAWEKSTLVATLENQYGLRHGVARFLAGQIELQIFALNYRVITKPFLAELVRNEVLAWGLADEKALQSDSSVCRQPVAPSSTEEET